VKVATMSSTAVPANNNNIELEEGHSLWYDAYLRMKKKPIAVVSFWVIAVYLIIAALCGFDLIFTSYDVVDNAKEHLAPSWQHWMGTDIFGRDVLARAAHGTLTSLIVGAFGAGLAVFIGTFLGSLGGYFGGKVDELVVWFYTTIDTIPYILLVVSFSFVMGPSLQTLCLAIGLTGWVGHCRIIRAEYIKHRDLDYVQGAAALGAGHLRRMYRHILPNVSHLMLINFSLGFVSAIKSEVILSFLGLGVEPGTPSWGVMINDAKGELFKGVWWGLVAATIFMFFLVLAVNLFNSELRDALDPKLKNK
jgi:ABC-type dipeptide/oligopeptide/nickel transport system permease subunit